VEVDVRVGKSLLIGTVALGVTVGAANPVAQDPPPAAGGRGRQGGPGAAGRGRGPNFPQQQRPLADAGVLARGKGLYESSCAACHGVDLRGGQLGGPNLLRSQLVLSDKAGELIVPVVWKTRGGTHTGHRGVGMWRQYLFMETHDNYLVKIDARTGKKSGMSRSRRSSSSTSHRWRRSSLAIM
jgi:hypothetical protein